MSHYQEDDLILYFYGEGRKRPDIERHLDECSACAATYREIAGTLSMIVCLGFLLLTVGLMAAPWHLFMAPLKHPEEPPSAMTYPVVSFGVAAGLIVGATAVVVPLRMGIQALRKMEF